MSSSLRVNTIVPSTGTNVAIGTANGTVTFTDSVNFVLGTGSSIFSPASNTLTFGTNDAERVRITSNGSVAIGVNSPSDILHVGGNNAFIRVDRPNGNPGLTLIYNSTNSTRADIDVTTGGDLRFATNSSTERVRITSGGLVGVNCTPLAQFQVKAGTNQNIALSSMSSEASIEAFNDAGSANVPLRLRGQDFKFYTSSTERLRIESGGDVSIGGMDANTFSNYTTLTIGGAGAVTGSGIDFERSDGNIYGRIFGDANGLQIGALQSGDYIRFETANGTERVRISSSGSVGIGINNPQDYHASANSLVTSSGITLANTSQGSIYFADSSSGTGEYVGQINYYHSNNQLSFITNNTERMRLSGNGEHMVYSNGTVSALRTAASSSGSAEILYCTRNSSSVTVGTGVYAIYSNGSASSLSDRTQKKNIETTRDGYLEDLNRLRVVKYNWNDQEDGTPKELGLIAQEVEEVFPGLISDMRSDVGIGTTASTKGVKTSVLPYMLLKALQEANAEIVALKARVNTLEGS